MTVNLRLTLIVNDHELDDLIRETIFSDIKEILLFSYPNMSDKINEIKSDFKGLYSEEFMGVLW
jgi:hypothetical protein